MSSSPDSTQLFLDLRAGQQATIEQLLPIIYDELRRIAHFHLSKHRPGDTLNTTALVHEAYLKLIDQTQVVWQDRAHFCALAARAMRFILIDYARRYQAQKRGGDLFRVTLEGMPVSAEERAADLIALDEALARLSQVDERLAQVVEHRFFGGLTVEETGAVLGCSPRTVKREWQKARLWLYRAMQEA